MKSKIIGIGLSRTGTESLTECLRQAGLTIIHYPNKKEMLAFDNDGFTDIQGAAHYKEMDLKFPNSKFIYTTREKTEWVYAVEKYFREKSWQRMSDRQLELRLAVYNHINPDILTLAEAYDKHDYEVKQYFRNRPKDMLELNIIGGDKPKKLFDFLGLSNPPESFPHENKLSDKWWSK